MGDEDLSNLAAQLWVYVHAMPDQPLPWLLNVGWSANELLATGRCFDIRARCMR
jgi:hypothetical protein